MNTLGGYANIYGIIDLSGATPYIYATGKVSRITGGMFLKAFGEETHVLDSRAMLYGSLSSEGNNMKGLLSRMNGNLIVYSKGGVIKKWNLLSKIFGLLNVYDLLKGKIDLKQEGLSYKRMGATFTVKNGIFNTKDFLIDSPSMLITGNGNLDMNKNEIDGSIAVSPLVTVDRIINKIPILRKIIRVKEKGFLYTAYNVKGPINDPDISLNFTESIGGGMVDILRNILVLPKEVFEE
ncbi:MAG: AsmA-like C-terminal region-containing protein, partial [Proteobacteria bacterium]|nr:AsmA-like C-terminal region-containing protein [Pseudomonadota bacterium]